MEYREHILWHETRAFVIHYHVIFVEFHQPPRLSTYKLPPRWIGVTMQTLFQTRLETRCQFIGRLGRLYALHIFVVAGVWLYIAYFYNTAVLCDAVNPGSRETVRLGKNVTLLWRHDGDDSVLNQQPCSTVYSDADQRKHQSSASLAFVRGIHRGPVNSPHKWPVTRKMFPFDDVIMKPMSIRNLLLGSTTGFFQIRQGQFTAWWRHQMKIFSALLALCEVTGGFTSHKPVTRSFDVFFDLNKRLSKQSRHWWFESPLRSLWRHYNGRWVGG